MSLIRKNRHSYETAGPDYEKYFFDDETGGYILIHQGHNRGESFASEIFVAYAFAKQGRGIELVDESRDGRSFDAMVDGEAWEFTELTCNARNIKNAIQKGIKIGKYQAPRIAYHVNRDADIRLANTGIKNALFWDEDQRVTSVAVVSRDGNLQVLSREDINDGKLFE